MTKLESSVLETKQLLSDPNMAAKLIVGKRTLISECIPESEIDG